MSTPEPGWPLRRIVVLPLLLFALVSGLVLTLALLHPAKPSASAAGPVQLGDAYRGETVFQRSCAGCHGAGGGGGSGPRLAGAQLPLGRAKAQIENGGGAMPAGLVEGRELEDVLAYLATILDG